MTDKDFNNIVSNRLEQCRNTLTTKNKEYSSDVCRLHNFKTAARIDNETPEQALWGMYKKHLVSVIDLKNAPDTATLELIHEKITDTVNYMLLLEGLLVERIANNAEAINPHIQTNRK